MESLLKYVIDEYEGIKVIVLHGSLNSSTSVTFKKIVYKFLKSNSVILNMETVTSITTAGLKAITDVSYDAREDGKRVVVMQPSYKFITLTETLNLSRYFTFSKSLEESKKKIDVFT